METKFIKVLLQNKRKIYIDKDKMKFYIDNNESTMWLQRKFFFINDFGDFNLMLKDEWKYTITKKDGSQEIILGKEVIVKLKKFLKNR